MSVMMAEPEELYQVVRYVRPLHLLAARAVSDALAGEHITMGIRAVLECLSDRGPLPVPGIGRALSLPRQVVQRLCDQALEQGLVATGPNPAHRRSPLITLTGAGRAAFDRLHAVELRNLAEIAAGLPAADVAAAMRVLDALVTGLPRFTRAGGPDPIQEEFA
jgi:DNA-binding MarR family transcriptional regulator